MTDERDQLAEAICVCTGNHDPLTRVECRYAENAAARVVAAGWRPPAAAGADDLPCWITGCWRPQRGVNGSGLAVCDVHGDNLRQPPGSSSEDGAR